ncbi:MAG TPA: Gfo/Idh/MocA family oxidoreductase [Terriglobales bacterium]|nr:Gfo/Idh/MocA family oxidoreductase [Terriglobales bacterium]
MSGTRIGVIGAGWWATESHIPVLQAMPDVEVTCICGVDGEQLRKVQSRFGISNATEDYKELLSREDVDGVVVSSPHGFHFEHAVAALERGFPVLCEKPMALKASEAAQLVELVKAKGVPFLIPYGWNYSELARLGKLVIDEGTIGEIEHVLCHMGSPLRDLLSGTGAWVAEQSLLRPGQGTWSDPSSGGGFAHGQLTHALALMFWITGLQASEVFAMVGRSQSGSDLYNSISCRFSNGATGMLGGVGTMPRQSPFQVDIRIFGRNGMILLDVERPRFEVHLNDGTVTSSDPQQAPGAYACVEPLKTFVGLIQGKAVENRSPVWIGERVVQILDAALRSAQSGQSQNLSKPS